MCACVLNKLCLPFWWASLDFNTNNSFMKFWFAHHLNHRYAFLALYGTFTHTHTHSRGWQPYLIEQAIQSQVLVNYQSPTSLQNISEGINDTKQLNENSKTKKNSWIPFGNRITSKWLSQWCWFVCLSMCVCKRKHDHVHDWNEIHTLTHTVKICPWPLIVVTHKEVGIHSCV